ncbi:MAG: GntR family transcriptional regulator [Anaerolineae bacterium]
MTPENVRAAVGLGGSVKEESVQLPSLPRTALLRDQVYETLRDSILRGVLPPTYRLVEEELAGQLGVSRTPVREAIQRLQIEGLVVASSVRGFEVASVDPQDIEGTLDIRLLLESYAARRATTHMTAVQLEELQKIVRREQECLGSGSLDEMAELNRDFHTQLVAGSGNRTLVNLVEYLLRHSASYRLFALGEPDNLRLFCESHCRLVRALEEHDADAAEAEVVYHIGLAREILTSGRSLS